ncbi:MAG: BMP family lipoprotein [Bacillota bacterium]
MKKIIIPLLIFAVIFAFSGVGQAEGNIAVVFATGGLGDQSFNDSAHRGLERAEEELGITFNYAEPGAVSEYENYLRQFSATGQYDLIISIGFDQADALESVSSQFPDQKYAIVDTVVDNDNVASYVYREKERGFLLGAISAMMTTRDENEMINSEKVIGVVGGMDIPLIEANIAGFMAGAKYIEPNIKVLHSYVGDWADPSKAKEMTISMYEKDADIVWGAAGRSGLGVIQAAQENDFYAIGSDSDQGHVAPDHVLTNGMKYVNNTVYLAVEQVLNDEFEPGVHNLGVEENGLGFTESLLPDKILQRMEAVKANVVSGNVDIPEKIENVK